MVQIIPLKIEGINEKYFSGFWSRLGANLLDMLIIMPFIILIQFINSLNLYNFYFTIIPNLLFIFWYNIFLPKKYSGTPGKLIVGLKIVKMDASQIDWRESFLRHSVNILFIFLNIFMMVSAILKVDIIIYNDLNWLQQSEYLSSFSNITLLTTLSNIWIWSEIIVLLFNKRRRAIHDYIAGTVIVKSKYVEIIRKNMEELKNNEI